ncbi:hypothetical protein CONCODRAFT_10647 [Conidiobolus coronatus NRRL 28638]|uniref:Uncharacterized protein n=1 Tax=Conidiobolus coronatus (strain ATCC 28846 / CBS 209.66 / NRRL 28638) TaxID=796925 RepID=A0A137NXC2_CONC2|nr:hypothetical protein CONCODRAFT_10647 [Conidiobolus coronatus NRRL 28638]|eukprot:KXN67304.1 hypothetical protein CONCODRAFT_10647 [Conidiobolus coronatus NRRL 28638]
MKPIIFVISFLTPILCQLFPGVYYFQPVDFPNSELTISSENTSTNHLDFITTDLIFLSGISSLSRWIIKSETAQTQSIPKYFIQNYKTKQYLSSSGQNVTLSIDTPFAWVISGSGPNFQVICKIGEGGEYYCITVEQKGLLSSDLNMKLERLDQGIDQFWTAHKLT